MVHEEPSCRRVVITSQFRRPLACLGKSGQYRSPMGARNGSLSSNHRTTLIDRFYYVIFSFMSMKHHSHHRNLLSCPEKNTYLHVLGHFFTMSQNPIYTPAIFFPLILVFAAVCCPIHFACAQTDPVHSLLYVSQNARLNHDRRIPDQQSVQIRNPRNHHKQIL